MTNTNRNGTFHMLGINSVGGYQEVHSFYLSDGYGVMSVSVLGEQGWVKTFTHTPKFNARRTLREMYRQLLTDGFKPASQAELAGAHLSK